MIEPLRQSLRNGDLPEVESALDDATVLHMPGGSGLAGDYQGREPILALFARMVDLTGGTCRFSPTRVLTETSTALIVDGTESAARGSRELRTAALYVFSLSDQTIREIWVLHEEQQRVDEFWAGG